MECISRSGVWPFVVVVTLGCASSGGGAGGGGGSNSNGTGVGSSLYGVLDDGSCAAIATKVSSCGLIGDGANNCGAARPESIASYEQCAADCYAQATCTQISDVMCGDASDPSPLRGCLGPCGSPYLPPSFGGTSGIALNCTSATPGTYARPCNGVVECADGSDENTCAQFTCASGEIILDSKHCDNSSFDCADGSDETACPFGKVLTCSDGTLIFAHQICDRLGQCANNEDEAQCFACSDGTQLLPILRCDGVAQCPNSGDELGCAEEICPTAP